MRSIFKVFLIPMLLLIWICTLYSFQLYPVPVIKFDEVNHDFGVVKQGEKLKHIYKFTNEGDGKLIITSVQPSCGCTGVIMEDKKEFETGETGEIIITFNTQGRTGVNSKTVSVLTNDSSNFKITLTFTCLIQESK